MSVLLGLAVGFVAVRLLAVAGGELLGTPALARPNFRDLAVPAAGGVLVVAAVLVVEATRATVGALGVGDLPGQNPARTLVLFACFGFGFLGIVDDLLGTDEDRGFAGHLRALRHGRITTGALKLVGGGGIALVLAAAPGFVTGKRLLADALLIALAANLGNLLDRAPGRAIKISLLAYAPLALVAGTGAVGVAIAPVMGGAMGLLPDDLRERIMLGDAGANVLGGVLGLATVLTVGRGARTGVLVALVALNLLAEVVSFARIIDRVAPLRAFDSWGHRPDPPPAAPPGR
jgi:UDP-GlcNAc:undecaprenyl-phosphate/decaprenyl-phosphate GlcNAc-1-phosphate transferase